MATLDVLQARLALIQGAIASIISGAAQSYEIEGQRVTKLDLDRLMREEERLLARIARLSGTARTSIAFTRSKGA